MKKKPVFITLCIIAVVIIAIVIAIVINSSNSGDLQTADDNTYVSDSFDNFEYAEGISGFYSDYDSETSTEIYGLALPYKSEANIFEIVNIGRYTGEFMEDGSDDSVTNVLAMLVKNTGDTMLEFLELQFTDDDGNIYTFNISTLPAGKECLVLESNRTVYANNIKLSFQEVIPVYKEDVNMMSDEISFSVEYPEDSEAAEITLTNTGENDFEKVHVCYKTAVDGIYIGGITYRTTFENLKHGESLKNIVSHFYNGSSNIVLIEEGE